VLLRGKKGKFYQICKCTYSVYVQSTLLVISSLRNRALVECESMHSVRRA